MKTMGIIFSWHNPLMQCIETEGNKYTISRSFLEEANIVVAHGIVIRRFSYEPYIPFCGISEIDFDESFKYTDFQAY